MPTYEFRCPEGHEFEKFYRKMSDAAMELPCPVCGKPAARQLSGGAGLLFKGSGFYLTDYGKNAHRKGGPTPSGSGESKGGDPKPSESKPAAEAKPASDSSASKPAEKPSSKPSSKPSPGGEH